MLPEAMRGLSRILVVRMDNIGDLVMLSPALRALRIAFPHATISLLASPGGASLAPLLPWVDEIIPWRASWQDISSTHETQPEQESILVNRLRQGRYDAAFIFTSFAQSPYPPAHLCYMAGIPLRIGQSKEFGGALLTHWFKPESDSTHQTDRNLFLLRSCGIPVTDDRLELHIPPKDLSQANHFLRHYGINEGQPFLAIAPGASASARRYPADRFLQAVNLLMDKTGIPAVILGSQQESSSLAVFQEASRTRTSLRWMVGQTTPGEFAAILSRAVLVMTNNSASLHIAEAFQRPMIILYSGTEYLSQWAPRYTPALILNRKVSCSPCYAFACPYQLECLDFTPEEVASRAAQFLLQQQKLPGLILSSPVMDRKVSHE